MKDLIFSIVLVVAFSVCCNALPTVAICGFDGSGTTSGAGDEFTFVLLKDFSAGEVIYFTEDEYSDLADAFFSGEGHLAYTVPAGGLLENDVVRIRETGVNVFTVQCASGTATHVSGSGTWSFSGSDELYAYSASNATTPWSSVTEIHCFYYGSVIAPTTDQNPTPDWPNTIKVAPNFGASSAPNTDFIDAFRIDTTIPILQNAANWVTNTSDITLSCTNFTNQMLPIELISFGGILRDNEILLNWVTASEVNNEKFEIEHSVDGLRFTQIGSIAGSGTSNLTNTYKMVHRNPEFGINYYRLKQIDYDGAFSLSPLVAVKYQDDDKSSFAVYPNPFYQNITVKFSSLDENTTSGKVRTIEVYDQYGRLVLSNEAPLDKANIDLDLSRLSSGIYFIHSFEGAFTSTGVQRIVKI